jgi:hypothetical protein
MKYHFATEFELASIASKKGWETRRKNSAKTLVKTGLTTKKTRRQLHVLVNKLTLQQALQVLHSIISPK